MNIEMTVKLDTSGQVPAVTVKKSTIPLADAGLGLFASWTHGRDDVNGYYYRSTIYAKLTEEC